MVYLVSALVSGDNTFILRNNQIYQLSFLDELWHRSTIKVLGSVNGYPFDITIGVFELESQILSTRIGTSFYVLKFYTDSKNIYLKINMADNEIGQMIAFSFDTKYGYRKAKLSDIDIDKLTEYTF